MGVTLGELQRSKILVTGASGFLGRGLTSLLEGLGCPFVKAVGGLSGRPGHHGHRLEGFDLTRTADAEDLFDVRGDAPAYDYVFHLAGHNGGIAFNQEKPSDIFLINTQMGLNLLHTAHQAGAKKVVCVVASCAYPENELDYKNLTSENWDGYGEVFVPREVMREECFFDGPPHETVEAHAYAKRNLQLACKYLSRQHKFNAVCVCPTTLYGPGDSFDPERTKVMGGTVRRFVEAKDHGLPGVTVWGTGEPRREFLYVDDAARLLVECMLKYDDPFLPLNLGTGQEVSIRELAEAVSAEVLYTGDILYDTTRPDGQSRKRLDTTRMRRALGEFRFTPLEDGIARTVEGYRKWKEKVSSAASRSNTPPASTGSGRRRSSRTGAS